MDFENQDFIYCADDETIANNPPISISHTQTEKLFHTKHTIKNPNFFNSDKFYNDYITSHRKNYIYFLLNVILK